MLHKHLVLELLYSGMALAKGMYTLMVGICDIM